MSRQVPPTTSDNGARRFSLRQRFESRLALASSRPRSARLSRYVYATAVRRLVVLAALSMLCVGCGRDERADPNASAEQRSVQRADLLVTAHDGVYRVRGDGTKRLLFRVADRAAWSPDGRRIARLEPTGRKNAYGGPIAQLVTSRPDGRDRVRFRLPAFTSPLEVVDFSWSRDGRMAVAARGTAGEEPPHRLYVARPDGSERQEPSRCRDISAPAWAPDGRQIAFLCRGQRVEIVRTDGSGRRRLYDSEAQPAPVSPGFVARLLWRPDGRLLALNTQSTDAKVQTVSFLGVQGGRLRVGPRANDLSWSADGRLYAYSTSTGRAGIVIARAADNRTLRFIALRGAGALRWRPTT